MNALFHKCHFTLLLSFGPIIVFQSKNAVYRYNKCLATGMRREAVQDERNRGSGGGAGGRGANNSGGGGGQVSQIESAI